MLTAEELLAGSALTFEIEVPAHVLRPGERLDGRANAAGRTVRLRPLTVADLQLDLAGGQGERLAAGTLMVQRALVEPAMSVPRSTALHVGLVGIPPAQVNRISGIDATSAELAEAEGRAAGAGRPSSSRASSAGRREEIGELTLGQVLLHLQMLDER